MNKAAAPERRELLDAPEVRLLPKNALYIDGDALEELSAKTFNPVPNSPEDYESVKIYDAEDVWPLIVRTARLGGRYDYKIKVGGREERATILGLEDDPMYPQISSYQPVVTSINGVPHLALGRRAVKGEGDARLMGRWLGGFGGHVDVKDVLATDEESISTEEHLRRVFELAARREMEEELSLKPGEYTVGDPTSLFRMKFSDDQIIASRRDRSDHMAPVSSVHAAFVVPIFVPEEQIPNIHIDESEIAQVDFVPLNEYQQKLQELHDAGNTVESWTWILGTYFLDEIRDFAESQQRSNK